MDFPANYLYNCQIVVAGLGLPWLGYLHGYILAAVLKQPAPDALAISIETGIQNTGIAIFLLRFALDPLNADLTTGKFKILVLYGSNKGFIVVAPVSVAIMTPIPLTGIYLYNKLRDRLVCFYTHNTLKEKTHNI